MEILLFIIIGILILILVLLLLKVNIYESFDNQIKSEPENYLYPVKKLSGICAKDGLKPSYMPKACYIDGKMNTYANCKCEDDKGNCKICYPEIKKDSKNSSVVYNSTFT
jgi:hypothetical protein